MPARRRTRPVLVALALGLAASAAGREGTAADLQPHHEFSREDPDKIVGSDQCGECHTASYAVWEESPHALLYKELGKRSRAKQISRRLGYKLGLRRDTRCLKCHYTPVRRGEKLSAVAGVSCESCHGAARDWIHVHNDYGGKGRNHDNEPPEHRRERIEKARALGMRRPTDHYPVAQNCFGCHLVPDEDLVNDGLHKTGSKDFEVSAWTQDDRIRHNFLDSLRAGGDRVNRERPAEYKRMLFVAGKAMQLEQSLRALALATVNGRYLRGMTKKAAESIRELEQVAAETRARELQEMLTVARRVPLELGQKPALEAAADRIGALNRRFLARGDAPEVLVQVDELVEKAEVRYEEKVAREEARRQGGAKSGGAAGTERIAPVAKRPPPPPPPPLPAATGPELVDLSRYGEVVRRIRTPDRARVIAADDCIGCHDDLSRIDPNVWWEGHAHSRSFEPFRRREAKNRKIAIAYYGSFDPKNLTSAGALCADCHATVESGQSGDARAGVSCQSCHGAGGDFEDSHREEPGSGYNLGMVKLDDLGVRARRCLDCHHVTEARLLAAGHPSGEGFDPVEAMKDIRHWDGDLGGSDAALRSAFAAERAKRSLPRVEVVSLDEIPEGPPGGARASGGGARAGGAGPSAGAARERAAAPGLDGPLPDLAEIPPDAPPHVVLEALSQRLDTLHQALLRQGARR